MKTRSAILIILSIVISSCSDVSDNTKTSTSDIDQEQPALSVAEIEVDLTELPVEARSIEETATASNEAPGHDQNSASAAGAVLPDRDDVKGIAAYCWAYPDRCVGKGDPNAPIIMVEISDYGCGHCRNFNLETAPEIDDLYIETGDVYWLVLPYSLSSQRVSAPVSALCAAEQGSFYDYHRRMFEIFGDEDAGTLDGYSRIAGELGLDMVALTGCMVSERYYTVVEQNIAVARALGVSATPSFFIGEQSIEGNYPLDALRQLIDSEIEASS
jgi:protein-disulfide isomerase